MTFSVSDAAPGTPEAVLARMFEPFFSTKEEGMGLGLSIGRTMVEEHGGRLWAANGAPGATPCFALPAAAPSPPVASAARDLSPSRRSG